MEDLQTALDAIFREQRGEGGFPSDTNGNFSLISRRVAFSGDSPESEALDYVVDHGFCDALAAELRRDPIREDIVDIGLVASTTVCLSERNAAKIANSELVGAMASYLKKYAPQPIAAYALTALTVRRF